MLLETEHFGDYGRSDQAEKDYVIPLVTNKANNNEISDDLDGNGFTNARTPIQEFYAGEKVFITGGTGFLGKVVVEKLLRSCPDISTVFLLVRAKKNKTAKDRIDELLNNPLYDGLKEMSPNFQHKIVGMEGDCSAPGLGLSSADRERILREVSIVFHSAANVRFHERMDEALKINVASTLDILDLCKHMDRLKVFIHVSTAYSNSHVPRIEEKFYPHITTYEDLDKQLKRLDEREMEKMTLKIRRDWPNNYAFTKALAEVVIKERNNGLKMGIFRPAIIISSVKEPIKGWVDNFYGPTGVVAAAYTGVLRSLRISPSIPANIVPVDYSANALISCAWDVATNHPERKDDKMMIYNYVSTVESLFTWGDYSMNNIIFSKAYPLSTAMWTVFMKIQSSSLMNVLGRIIFHYIPAFLFDASCVCLGRQPQLVKTYTKVHKFMDAIEPFITRNWTFTNDNVVNMWERLTVKDQKIFEFSIKKIDWVMYMHDCVKGIRVYLLKDDFSTLKAGHRRQNRFNVVNEILKGLLFTFILWILWKIVSAAFF